MSEQGERIALVAGGSGLVGSRLLPLLLSAAEYTRVYALSRRPLALEHPRLANRVMRFDLPLEPQLKGLVCQDAFCCLGTTLRAAGSPAAFHAIDHDLVVSFARLARARGAIRLVAVSSIGAQVASRNFYLRVKGETERDLRTLGLPALDLLQPSLLLGGRSESRIGELAARGALWIAGPLLRGPLARYHAIGAEAVAAAMLGAVRSGRRGIHHYLYPDLLRLSRLARQATTVTQ